jgi:hypothetical protein
MSAVRRVVVLYEVNMNSKKDAYRINIFLVIEGFSTIKSVSVAVSATSMHVVASLIAVITTGDAGIGVLPRNFLSFRCGTAVSRTVSNATRLGACRRSKDRHCHRCSKIYWMSADGQGGHWKISVRRDSEGRYGGKSPRDRNSNRNFIRKRSDRPFSSSTRSGAARLRPRARSARRAGDS